MIMLWSWRCIGCGRCFAPSVPECPYCIPRTFAIETGTASPTLHPFPYEASTACAVNHIVYF